MKQIIVYLTKLLRLLRKPKIHYHVDKSLTLVHVQNQINAVRTITPYFLKILFNIIHQFMPESSKQYPSFGISK
jgi:hypothetical protein